MSYYVQAASGQAELLTGRKPIARIIDDPATSPSLREFLESARQMREFAAAELGLASGGNYHGYVALDRPFVVWSVVAAPPLSLEPRTWCFPVAGCVSYRGYFSKERAQAFAAVQAAAGDDVYVGGVRAYSTLGWFDDPLLSTMLDLQMFDLAGIIFHELAHRRLYVPGDSDFNEAFATTVEREGVRRWLRAQGDEAEQRRHAEVLARRDATIALVMETRERLATVYSGPLSEQAMLEAKANELQRLRERYRALVGDAPELHAAAAWFDRDLNNARLASVATYHALVPALEALLVREQHDLSAFYLACEALAALEPERRRQRLLAGTDG